MVSSQLEAFLETMAGECDEKSLRSIKASDIFYSVSNRPVFSLLSCQIFFYCRQEFQSWEILYFTSLRENSGAELFVY